MAGYSGLVRVTRLLQPKGYEGKIIVVNSTEPGAPPLDTTVRSEEDLAPNLVVGLTVKASFSFVLDEWRATDTVLDPDYEGYRKFRLITMHHLNPGNNGTVFSQLVDFNVKNNNEDLPYNAAGFGNNAILVNMYVPKDDEYKLMLVGRGSSQPNVPEAYIYSQVEFKDVISLMDGIGFPTSPANTFQQILKQLSNQALGQTIGNGISLPFYLKVLY